MQQTLKVLSDEDLKKKWFVTGGAGFIGSQFVDLLVSANCSVTVYDNFCLSSDQYIKEHVENNRINFIKADMTDLDMVIQSMEGHDIVVHLGANTDIPSGFNNQRIDLNNSVISTCNILEAMRRNDVKEMLFSSTGAVYGNRIEGIFREDSGPLIPLSHYGAGKIASEGFISSYCNLYGIKAWMFRFGNVLGGRMSHGIVFDFVHKLKQNPNCLEVLGTGKGEKNYFLIEECIHGMLYVRKMCPNGPFPVLYNLGTNSRSKIMEIAQIIIEEMECKDVKFEFTGTPVGWPGDQPVVLLDTQRLNALGWKSRYTSNEAVRKATRRILGREKPSISIDLLNSLYKTETYNHSASK